MTREEAHELAGRVRDGLPGSMRQRLKAIHVAPKLHQGMLTIRVYAISQTAEEPEAFIFAAQELL